MTITFGTDPPEAKPPSIVLKEQIDNFSGTFLVTDTSSQVLYANKHVRETTGYTPAEVIGKKPGQLWGGRMERSFYECLWQRIASERLPFVTEVKNIKKDKSIFREELHIAPIIGAEGEIKFFIELQSSSTGSAQGMAFKRDFEQSLGNQQDAAWSTVEFLLRTFSLSEAAWQAVPDAGVLTSRPRAQIVSFLESVLIAPTRVEYQERYADRELVLAAQNDHHVFEKLYMKYYRQIFRYFSQRTGHNAELAADLAQETFVQAFKSLPQFTISNASYVTYLLRIAHNLLVSYYRSHQSVPLDEIVIAETQAVPPTDYAALFDIERVWQAVARLAPIEQRIICLKYKDDLPVQDIAAQLGKSENAVKLHLSRAREKVRGMLGQ